MKRKCIEKRGVLSTRREAFTFMDFSWFTIRCFLMSDSFQAFAWRQSAIAYMRIFCLGLALGAGMDSLGFLERLFYGVYQPSLGVWAPPS